jgi:acetyl-CoA C-acetyltransferase
MKGFRKKIYAAAGYNTLYYGSGRKEFDPKNMPPYETYLKETARGTCQQLKSIQLDEGIIGSFMSGRFINQANLPGFLPFMVPELRYKPCTGIEGACGTGGRALGMAVRCVLSDLSDAVFVAGIEMQNTLKAVYGADVLAGASYYRGERKKGAAFFFPALFAERAGAYMNRFGEEETRRAMAKWVEIAFANARLNPKAQEYHNTLPDVFEKAMAPPNAKTFIPYLNPLHCSKVTDGASSLVILSEEGVKKCGVEGVVEIVALGEAEEDITEPPVDLTELTTTKKAVSQALDKAGIDIDELGVLEIHDCFAITALLAFEAIGFAPKGKGGQFILEGRSKSGIPTNLSGGLHGFGHPTGATGVRQMVDLLHQCTRRAENQIEMKKPYGMMISMGGNDKTVTCIIVKKVGE